MTVYQLELSMGVDEFQNWSTYLRDETPSPNELQMAVLSNMISRYMGNKTSTYKDFLIRKQNKTPISNKPISNTALLETFKTLGA